MATKLGAVRTAAGSASHHIGRDAAHLAHGAPMATSGTLAIPAALNIQTNASRRLGRDLPHSRCPVAATKRAAQNATYQDRGMPILVEPSE